jgi:hypothetical protein
MGPLIARTLPLAIGGAISPVLLVAVVLLLSGGHRPRLRAAAFAIGNIAALVVLTVVVATLFHSIGHTGTGPTTTGAVVDLTLGVLLILYGLGRLAELAYRGTHRDPVEGDDGAGGAGTGTEAQAGASAERQGGASPGPRRGGPVGALALGFALMATNVSTVALYLAALKDIGQARVDDVERIVTITVVILVVMVPVVVPLGLTVVAPRSSTRILAGVRAFVDRYRSLITGGFVTVFGMLLLVKGFRGA